jgi:DNA (cytosine-5)-methyltransferase 1
MPASKSAQSGVFKFYEFFAGGGMARAGLGDQWQCLFANDFDPMKADTYRRNWGGDIVCRDIAEVETTDLPGQADLAWASFPCQDLSLAGDYRGLGKQDDLIFTRSGTFWPFWQLITKLKRRKPKTIVLENVYGAITSNRGRDFQALAGALAYEGYVFGALVIDAKHFVPQSRPRLFIFAVRHDLQIPPALIARKLSDKWHHPTLRAAVDGLPENVRNRWMWWKLPSPPKRTKTFAKIIEKTPTGVSWDSQFDTRRLLSMMTPLNLRKVKEVQATMKKAVGGVYKRTRTHDGKKAQRAEVRFDDISGCLRTPAGGSSRQHILVVHGNDVRSRLLSPREAASLMGLDKNYILPPRYNDAYHVAGDGVVVNVVRHLAKNLIEPVLKAQEMRMAAE